eukprot:UN09719
MFLQEKKSKRRKSHISKATHLR